MINRSNAQRGADGSYSADATSAGVLGIPLNSTHANAGETDHGLLEPLQADLLDPLCKGLDKLACIQVLKADAKAGDHSAQSSTAVADASIANGAITTKAVDSNASTSDANGCTTAHGDATTAGLTVGNASLLNAGSSSSTSNSCAGTGPGTGPGNTNDNDSTVVKLLGVGLPVPVAGCGSGKPNSTLTLLSPVVATDCHANTSQTANGASGVREALDAFVLEGGGSALLKGTVGASESNAP